MDDVGQDGAFRRQDDSPARPGVLIPETRLLGSRTKIARCRRKVLKGDKIVIWLITKFLQTGYGVLCVTSEQPSLTLKNDLTSEHVIGVN
ncbi:hypothetical protein HW555_001874 [Spodoptera exigua]|uniref:Uncharacterized protein n=1 Tax=Spodoptera exigua TaxID=7107 RepID=A0A835GP86_SPOEX|nr:hypothetical protein HW555_001874 [Spodoptera exigua]